VAAGYLVIVERLGSQIYGWASAETVPNIWQEDGSSAGLPNIFVHGVKLIDHAISVCVGEDQGT
jgi:hypothetical protein